MGPTCIDCAGAELLDQRFTHMPHGDGDAAGHAALAGAAERREFDRTDGLVDISVGHDDQMILGTAGCLHPLAVARAGFIDRAGDGRRAHERDRAYERMRKQRPRGLAVAVHDAEDPLGQPRFDQELTQRTAESGTFSDGLSTNVFPHVIATGNIHSGTITGKLKGVIPTHTPSGCRIVSQST